jgi:hypothetical protein
VRCAGLADGVLLDATASGEIFVSFVMIKNPYPMAIMQMLIATDRDFVTQLKICIPPKK